MNDVLGIAIQHHLYIVPLALAGLWLLSRWGAEPKRKARPPKRDGGRVNVSSRASNPPTGNRIEQSGALGELKARFDSLALQRDELEQQIVELDGSGTSGLRGGGRKRRKR